MTWIVRKLGFHCWRCLASIKGGQLRDLLRRGL